MPYRLEPPAIAAAFFSCWNDSMPYPLFMAFNRRPSYLLRKPGRRKSVYSYDFKLLIIGRFLNHLVENILYTFGAGYRFVQADLHIV